MNEPFKPCLQCRHCQPSWPPGHFKCTSEHLPPDVLTGKHTHPLPDARYVNNATESHDRVCGDDGVYFQRADAPTRAQEIHRQFWGGAVIALLICALWWAVGAVR